MSCQPNAPERATNTDDVTHVQDAWLTN